MKYSVIAAMFWKDVMMEKRAKEMFPQMLAFAVLILVIFQITLQLGIPMQDVLPGILWVALTFAGMLGLNHSLAIEQEHGCFSGLRLCPVSRSAIFLGKMAGNWFFLLLMAAMVFPVIVVLFNLTPGWYFVLLGIVIALGSFGFAGIGTLFAMMSAQTRIREVLLPMLVFPVLIPLLIAAVNITAKILAQVALQELWFGFRFLAVFDAVFVGIAVLTAEFVIESE